MKLEKLTKAIVLLLETVTKNGMMEEDTASGFPSISDMMDRLDTQSSLY